MLKPVATIFASRLQLSIASLQTSTFQVTNRTTGAAMSIKNKSDVENHLSTGSNRNLFHLRQVSQPDVTSYPVDGIGRTDKTTQGIVQDSSGPPASAASPVGPSINPDDTFAVAIVKAPQA
jgi:hypothetical protein